MRSRTLTAAFLAVVMLTAVAVPAAAGTAAASDLTVSVSQPSPGAEATVTVTANGTAVENATVTVDPVNNTTYVGAGTYETDANGTVTLPAPEQNVTVSVTATHDNMTASTEATLLADANSPTTVTEDGPFGQEVSVFVHFLLSNGQMDGQDVSEFVREHNPGADNRPDHAGPPENETAQNETSGNETEHGPDGDTGPSSEDTHGADNRPDHAGPHNETADDDTDHGPDTEANENEGSENDDSDDTRRSDDDRGNGGGPEKGDGHPGNGKANGHGK